MASSLNSLRAVLFGVAAVLLSLVSVFWVFYTSRLLYVTNLLRATRAGGQGAYVGAIVFPLLALLFGWGAWRCWRVARRA